MSVGWFDYWNSAQSTFVSPQHLRAHYDAIGRDLVTILGPQRPCLLLDYGCGDALASPALADTGIDVVLYDPVPRVHERLKRQFSDTARVRVLDAPPWMELPPASLDVILVNSLLQYLSKDETVALFPRWHALLKPGGALYLADIVRPNVGMFADAGALLRAAWAHGFVRDAILGLGAMLFSNYRAIRQQHGFSTYEEAEIIGMLHANGFSARRIPKNVGFSQQRMLIRATR